VGPSPQSARGSTAQESAMICPCIRRSPQAVEDEPVSLWKRLAIGMAEEQKGGDGCASLHPG
jgi:hypothetical protein